MRRFLFALAFLLALAAPSQAAFGDLVGSCVTENDSSGTGSTLTLGTSPTAGNLLLIWHYTGDGDSQAGAGMTEAIAVTDAGATDQMALYYRVVLSGDSTTGPTGGGNWQFVSSGDEQHAAFICEFEGPFAASPLDQTDDTAATTGSPIDTITAGPTASTAASVLAVAIVGFRGQAGSQTESVNTWSDSFTERGDVPNELGAALKAIAGATKVLSSSGTPSTIADFINTGGNGPLRAMAAMATFVEDEGGEPPPTTCDPGLSLLGVSRGCV